MGPCASSVVVPRVRRRPSPGPAGPGPWRRRRRCSSGCARVPGAVLAHGGTVPTPPDAADAAVRLVVRSAGLAAGDRRPAAVARRRPAGEPGASRPTRSPAGGPPYWVRGRVRDPVRASTRASRAYDTTLFSMHMVQHLLLTLIGPPLLLLAGPITLLLQASIARDPPALDPAGAPLAARPAPVVPGRLVAAVRGRHVGEPLLAAVRPRRSRTSGRTASSTSCSSAPRSCSGGRSSVPTRRRGSSSPSARILYAGLAMPQNTFLALAIYMASAPLYAHYATTSRTWGPTPLEDQQVAGGIMWVGGDFVFLSILVADDLAVDARRGAAERGRGPPARGRAGGDPRARGRGWPRGAAAEGSASGTETGAAARLIRPRAGSAPGGTRGSASGSTLPPETTPTIGPSSPRRPASAARNRIAAIAQGARRLDDQARLLRGEPDRGGDLGLGHGDDVVEVGAQVGEVQAADRLGAGAVGDRAADALRRPGRRSAPARQRLAGVRRELGLHADHARVRARGPGSPRRPRWPGRRRRSARAPRRRPGSPRRSRGPPCPGRR